MAHKTKINATNYEIGGGKVRANSTAYSVEVGKTKVSATNYEIPFKKTGWTCIYSGQKTSTGTTTTTLPSISIPTDTVAIIADFMYGDNPGRGAVAYKLNETWCYASSVSDVVSSISVSSSNTLTIQYSEYASGTITKYAIYVLSGKGAWSNSTVTIAKDSTTTITGKTGWKFAVFGVSDTSNPNGYNKVRQTDQYFGAVGYDEIDSFSKAVSTSTTFKYGSVLCAYSEGSTASANTSGYSNSSFIIMNYSEKSSRTYAYYYYI